MEALAGNTITLGGSVWNLAVAPLKPKTSGTIYAVVRLNKPGDADDGKYWDTTGGGSWQASPGAWPTATYAKDARWSYTVPAAATTGKAGGEVMLVALTDNVATPASSTVVSGGLTHASVVSEDRLVVADIPTAAAVADAVWDETIPGQHVAQNTSGRFLQLARESTSVHSGTLQAGSTLSTVVFDTDAVNEDGYYDHNRVVISSGTGAGQARVIHGYVGSTRTATVIPDWVIAPDATSAFEILVDGKVDVYELSDPCNALIASAVRSELAAELARVDAAVSTRAPSATALSSATWTGDRAAKIDYLTDTVGSPLQASAYVAPPSAATVATATRAELATELGRVDASVSSRLAAASYVAPDNATIAAIDAAVGSPLQASSYVAPPSASTVASAVRSELTTELGRVDVSVSSRLAAVSYAAPPSAASVASATRAELATELGRVDVAVSTRESESAADVRASALDAAIGAVSLAVEPAGLYTLTIDPVDGDGARVAGVTVVVLSDALDPLWRETTTGAAAVALALDAGGYYVRVSRAGYTTTPASLAVAITDDTELEIELAVDTTTPATCTVYADITGPDGPISGATLEIAIAVPSERGGWSFSGTKSAISDAAGHVQISGVPQLAQVTVTCDALGWDHELRTVPASVSRALAGWVA
jgi:hypothetical protein